MTYQPLHVRSGLAAIAAVLALSSTHLAAQEVTAPPDPVTKTSSEAAPTADPLAPEPTASEPAAAEPTSSEAATTETATTARPVSRTRTAATPTRRTPSETASSSAPADAAVPATEAGAGSMPVPPASIPAVDPGAMPVDETVAETTAAPADDALPIAGAAGLGLLALGGIGMAVGRRRRRKEELAHMAANRQYLESHPSAGTPQPDDSAGAGTVSPAMTGAAPAFRTDVPRTKLPAGFDLSRFGPHVRAAYQGPTDDNPSLSMKHRLRRAAAMDQQARQHGEAPREAAHLAARPDQANKPIWNIGNDGFMLRRAPGKQPSKPAFQH